MQNKDDESIRKDEKRSIRDNLSDLMKACRFGDYNTAKRILELDSIEIHRALLNPKDIDSCYLSNTLDTYFQKPQTSSVEIMCLLIRKGISLSLLDKMGNNFFQRIFKMRSINHLKAVLETLEDRLTPKEFLNQVQAKNNQGENLVFDCLKAMKLQKFFLIVDYAPSYIHDLLDSTVDRQRFKEAIEHYPEEKKLELIDYLIKDFDIEKLIGLGLPIESPELNEFDHNPLSLPPSDESPLSLKKRKSYAAIPAAKSPLFFGTKSKDKFKPHVELTIQVPSPSDLNQMSGMMAGLASENQDQRLGNMVNVISQKLDQEPNKHIKVVNTDAVALNQSWKTLFEMINQCKILDAIEQFKSIDADDELKRCLLAVHPEHYVIDVIKKCIQVKVDQRHMSSKERHTLFVEPTDQDGDVIFTNGTFEIFIKDLASTLNNKSKLCFSFNLPTHHASKEQWAGFCVFNKTAIMVQHRLLQNPRTRIVITGLDVNRDNGMAINENGMEHYTHLDLYDSRVYPYQTFEEVRFCLNLKSKDIESRELVNGISISKEFDGMCWKHNNSRYMALDINLKKYKLKPIHPAITYAIKEIHKELEEASANKQMVALFIPLGWDSHQEETAGCSTIVLENGKESNLLKKDKIFCRFNDKDFSFFYAELFKLFKSYENSISELYFGLEGGYDPIVYKKQIELFINCASEHLLEHDNQEVIGHTLR